MDPAVPVRTTATASEAVVINERYALRDRIESGAMAEVYLADDLQLGRQVAVKVLQARQAGDPKGSNGSGVRRAPRQRSTTPTWSRSSIGASTRAGRSW